MVPDIEIKHYYNKYLEDANNDIIKFQESYNTANKLKLDARRSINNEYKFIAETLKINLNDYKKEWVLIQYNDKHELFNVVKSKIAANGTDNDNIKLLWIFKYCQLLKKCYDLYRGIELAKKRASLRFSEYRSYVDKFYRYGVHKCCLEGYAYRYGYGIGELSINRWKFDEGRNKRKLVDYRATATNKARIIAEGKTPYDKEMAEVYKLRGIKYEGVPYVVYKKSQVFYDIAIANNKYIDRQNINFEISDTMNSKLRGRSYEELAKECGTKENVLSLQCSLNAKLNIYNQVDTTAYLKYIRNVEQCKYKRGAHNSKNRQRF